MGEARDERQLGGAVALLLQAAPVLHLLLRRLLVQEVDIVDGQDIACAAALRAECRVLVDGMPDVEERHRPRKLAPHVVALQVVHLVAEGSDIVLRHQQRDVKPVRQFRRVALVPPPVVQPYLSQPAHRVAQNAQVYEYALLVHRCLSVLNLQKYEKKSVCRPSMRKILFPAPRHRSIIYASYTHHRRTQGEV